MDPKGPAATKPGTENQSLDSSGYLHNLVPNVHSSASHLTYSHVALQQTHGYSGLHQHRHDVMSPHSPAMLLQPMHPHPLSGPSLQHADNRGFFAAHHAADLHSVSHPHPHTTGGTYREISPQPIGEQRPSSVGDQHHPSLPVTTSYPHAQSNLQPHSEPVYHHRYTEDFSHMQAEGGQIVGQEIAHSNSASPQYAVQTLEQRDVEDVPMQTTTAVPREPSEQPGVKGYDPSSLSINFMTSKDTFRMWQIVKEERNWDDSQLAATLLECYETSLRGEACTTCKAPLSRYCSKCFTLSGKQITSSPQSHSLAELSTDANHPDSSIRGNELSINVSDDSHSITKTQGESIESDTKKKTGPNTNKEDMENTGNSCNNKKNIETCADSVTETDSKPKLDSSGKNDQPELERHVAEHGTEVRWDSVKQYRTLHCHLCQRDFTDPDQMTWHMAKHQKDMKYQCQLCKARFFYKDMLALHAKIHVMQPLQVYCDYCKAPFATMYALRQHMRRQVCQNALATQQLQLDSVTKEVLTDEKVKNGSIGKKGSKKHAEENSSSWTCHQCGDSFKSQCRLNRHLLIHSGEKEFGCQECGIGCSQLSHLVAHMKSHYRLRGFECRKCGRSFLDHADFAAHSCGTDNSQVEKPSKGRKKKKKKNSKSAESVKTGPDQKQPQPDQEQPISSKKSQSASHSQHQDSSGYETTASCFGLETVQQCLGFESGGDSLTYMSGPLSMPPMQAPTPVPVPVTEADLAGMETQSGGFKVNLAPVTQTSMIQNALDVVYGATMRGQEQNMHPVSSGLERQQNKRSKAGVLDDKEEDDESGGPGPKLYPFKCAECEKGFKSFQAMVAHTRSHPHPNHHCPHCSEKLPTAFSLSSHVCTIRSQKVFKCTVCGDLLRNQRNYRQHFRIHTGEKPYLCQHCGRDFNSSSNFTIHLAIHKEQKRYNCPQCSKAFSSKTNLNRHIMVHSGLKPHVCEVCGRGFSVPYRLTQHMRTHTGEKPYKCDQCGACFSCPGTLVGHKRVHTGEKPYKCEICGRGFALQRNRRSHYRTHRNRTV